jgi:hypothetical protein
VEPDSAPRSPEFPVQLDPGMDPHAIAETFTWGVQGLILLCGLVGMFLYMVRDAKLFPSGVLPVIVAAVGVLAVLGWGFAARRSSRRIVLFFLPGQVGVYSGGIFQYSFALAEMKRYYSSLYTTLKMLIPMLLLAAILGFLVYETIVRSPGGATSDEKVLLVYCLLFAIFGFIAMFRSQVLMMWFFIPDGKGKTNKSVGFYRRELRRVAQLQAETAGIA